MDENDATVAGQQEEKKGRHTGRETYGHSELEHSEKLLPTKAASENKVVQDGSRSVACQRCHN